MGRMRVALIQQLAAGVDPAENLRRAERFCREARSRDADIAVLPEMWAIGYSGYEPGDDAAFRRWQDQAVRPDGVFVSRLQAVARELDLAIVATYLQSWPGYPRNAATLIDRHGRALGTYAKVHTCAFMHMEATLTPGDDFPVFDLDTRDGMVKTGIMICYDLEFPESARILMLKGAEVILNPVSCDLESKRHGQLQARARENAVCVASVNYPSPFQKGRSIAFDAEGDRVAEGPEGEAIVTADFDIPRLRAYRETTIWGNAYRRPARYPLLIAPDVRAPFVRKTALGQPFERG